MFAQQMNSGSVLHGKSSRLAAEFRKSARSIDQQLDFLNTRMDFGSSSQNVAKHDLNMQLDPGFRAVFACWMHVFSEAELRISVQNPSEFRPGG